MPPKKRKIRGIRRFQSGPTNPVRRRVEDTKPMKQARKKWTPKDE